MAGERKGEAFEALTVLALEACGFELDRNLFWGSSIESISIRPDIVMGTLDAPTHWLLLTSTGSASNSHMKFWRNIGELFEVKRKLEPPPNVVSLSFEDQQMAGFRKATEELVDSDLRLHELTYGARLISFVDSILKTLPPNRLDKLRAIREHVEIDTIKNDLSQYSDDLRKHLDLASKRNLVLWELLRDLKPGRAREARITYLRRGMAKLMLCRDSYRHILYESTSNRRALSSCPKHFRELGWVSPTIVGLSLTDKELFWVLQNFSIEQLEGIVHSAYQESPSLWDEWRDQIGSDQILSHYDYLLKHWTEMTTAAGMYRHLQNHNPGGFQWLFHLVLEVVRYSTGRRQGYGFSELARDVGYDQGINRGYKILADWANGSLKSRFPSQLISDVARALSERIRPLNPSRIQPEALSGFAKLNLFEQKIATYGKLEPIRILIEEALKKTQIDWKLVRRFPTLAGELLGTPNLKTTPLIAANHTLIHWKSASEAGSAHKVKELSARAQSIRITYVGGQYEWRDHFNALYLVVDGTFTQKELEVLLDSGWDEIFYPDEMDKLLSSIV